MISIEKVLEKETEITEVFSFKMPQHVLYIDNWGVLIHMYNSFLDKGLL